MAKLRKGGIELVKGLNQFANYFKDYADNYVIVGGTACTLVMDIHDEEFRTTKDIDMIIVAETMSESFGNRFWQFIKDGKYDKFRSSDGKTHFYRFLNPKNAGFPAMIELFSRKQDIFSDEILSTIAPIAIGYDVSSLSAILLDDNYYNFLLKGKVIARGLPVLDAPYLVAFKARAFVNLMSQRQANEHVNTRDWKKHKNDVFRMAHYLESTDLSSVDEDIKNDIKVFLDEISKNPPTMDDIGVETSLETNISYIKKCFGIE
ncbi:MAG: hypothetical protein LUE27_04605 [Clostridia bacterium]|nr:hypothetical protein [Clostridia bacterium]